METVEPGAGSALAQPWPTGLLKPPESSFRLLHLPRWGEGHSGQCRLSHSLPICCFGQGFQVWILWGTSRWWERGQLLAHVHPGPQAQAMPLMPRACLEEDGQRMIPNLREGLGGLANIYRKAWGSTHLPAPGEHPGSTWATLGASAASFPALGPEMAGLAWKAR